MRRVILDEIAVILVKDCYEKDHDRYKRFREIVESVKAGGPEVVYEFERGVVSFERMKGHETLFKATIRLKNVVIIDREVRVEPQLPDSIVTDQNQKAQTGHLKFGEVVEFEPLKYRIVQSVEQFSFADKNVTRYNLISGNTVTWESVKEQLEGKLVQDFRG